MADLGAITVTIASPAVVTKTAHGFPVGKEVIFGTSGALPTGITAGTSYYVIATGLTANAFQFSTSRGGSAVNTTGSQSGSHYVLMGYVDKSGGINGGHGGGYSGQDAKEQWTANGEGAIPRHMYNPWGHMSSGNSNKQGGGVSIA